MDQLDQPRHAFSAAIIAGCFTCTEGVCRIQCEGKGGPMTTFVTQHVTFSQRGLHPPGWLSPPLRCAQTSTLSACNNSCRRSQDFGVRIGLQSHSEGSRRDARLQPCLAALHQGVHAAGLADLAKLTGLIERMLSYPPLAVVWFRSLWGRVTY